MSEPISLDRGDFVDLLRSAGMSLLAVAGVKVTEWMLGTDTTFMMSVPSAVVAAAVMAAINSVGEWLRAGNLSKDAMLHTAKGAGIAAVGVLMSAVRSRLATGAWSQISPDEVALSPVLVYMLKKALSGPDSPAKQP